MTYKETSTIHWKLKKKAKDRLSREQGTVFKDPGGKLRVALVYPSTYRVGMSSLALQAIYSLLNDIDYVLCERLFLPAPADMEEYRDTPLFTLESQSAIKEFDIIAFSVSFEEDYLNIPVILDMAGVPVFSADRGDDDPLVLVGGAAVSLNPEPVADFMDLIIVGDGEGALLEVIERFIDGAGKATPPGEYSNIAGVYVPSFYSLTYDGAVIKEIKARPRAPKKITAGKIFDPDKFPMPKTSVVTNDTEFSGTVLMEIEKGCGRACRFCAAGFLYLPPRFRDYDLVKQSMKEALKEFGKVGLVGAAVSEFPGLNELLAEAVKLKGVVTMSSIRAEMIDPHLLSLMKECGYKTVTIAPEAGTTRGRHIINKCMSEEVILEAARMIGEAGFVKLKLYFLVGLPGESLEDALEIARLTGRIRESFPKGKITVSINPFIPKAVTPFQWYPFERLDILEESVKAVKKALMDIKGVEVNIFSPRKAYWQAVLSRGDRRLAKVIFDAALQFNGSLKRAFKANKDALPSADEYAYRERGEAEILPWESLDFGLDKGYLYKEYQRGLEAKETAPCVVGKCTRCGVC